MLQNGLLPVLLSLLPETDSSLEAVNWGAYDESTQSALNPALYHYGVVPEMSLASPTVRQTAARPVPAPVNQPRPDSLPPSPPVPATGSDPKPIRLVTVPVQPMTPKQVIAPLALRDGANQNPEPVSVLPQWLPEKKAVGQQPVLPQPKKPAATVLDSRIVEENEIRPVVVNVVSWISYGVAAILLAMWIIYAGVLASIESILVGSLKAPVWGSFLSTYPIFAILLNVLGLVLTGLVFLGQLVKDGSRRSLYWLMAVIFLGGLVILILGKIVTAPIGRLFQNPQLTGGSELLSSLSESWFSGSIYLIVGSLAVFLVICILLLSRFKYAKASIKGLSAWLIGSVTIIGFLMSLVPVITSVVLAVNTDYGYVETNNSAGFQVYRPSELPLGWVQVDQFHLNDDAGALLVGRNEFVQSSYDISLARRIEGMPSQLITMRQIEVPSGFDMESFTKTIVEGARIEKVSIAAAKNQEAYLLENIEGGITIRALAYITGDNVLILFSSKLATLNSLVDLATVVD
jgi:hypothetical protein